MPIKRIYLPPLIVLLAASILIYGCGDADDSYEGDPIEILEEMAVEKEKATTVTSPPEEEESTSVLNEVTAVASYTNNQSPSYTFSSTVLGKIQYGGLCSSGTSVAKIGNNKIILN